MNIAQTLRFFSPRNFKTSFEYRKWYKFINESQWWTENEHLNFQWKSIKKLLEYVYRYIPYYQEVFKNLNATPQDFHSISDFVIFPFLTKEIIRERLDDMIPRNINMNRLILYNTGGSTGVPLSFYKTKRDDIIEKAFMSSQWSRVGYHQHDTRVVIRGEVLSKGKLWEKSRNSNILKISAYDLSGQNIRVLIDKINEFQPKFFHVYPTSIQIFTQLLKEQNLSLNYIPKAILCGSEKLYDYQRNNLEDFFHCRVYSWLGLAEQTILAGECEYSEKLHIYSEHSYIELIDNNDNLITNSGIQGEIVGTRLHRFIIPFIRYRSGDLSSYAEPGCTCKRNYKLLDGVEGRVQDVVVTSQNKKIPVTALFFGQHLKVFEKALKIQLLQDIPGVVIIKLVKGKGYNEEDEKELLSKLGMATENKIKFTLHYSDGIDATSRGKHRFLISTIN